MAEECTENSMATTSSMHSWWHDLHVCNSLSSWTTSGPWQYEPKNSNKNNNNNSESSAEENVSISTCLTNASNHSDLSTESVRSLVLESGAGIHEFVEETVISDNHLWNHLLLSVGCRGELHNQEVEQSSVNAKNNISAAMFSPSGLTSFNGPIESPREPKLSNVNWQLPPEDATISNDLARHSVTKDSFDGRNFGSVSCFGHDLKLVQEHSNGTHQYPRTLISNSYSYGFPNAPSFTNSTSFTDQLIASPSFMNRPLLDINLSKPFLKTLDLSVCRRKAFQTYPFPSPTSICKTQTKRNGRTQGNEGRKRSPENNAESVSKKTKHETYAVSSTKGQVRVTKVKLADKITALQQIVSPFGKTDTASVLWEAIGYIRFLQEQIQLLSTPYLKGCASKELWGRLERKDRREGKLDLKSRGLCLVPISCTPHVYPENSASDYLTPMYRGCLYK